MRGLKKVTQTLSVLPFPGGLPQPQGYPTCGRKKHNINSSIKQSQLVVASWNMRSLQETELGARRRTALIACELARYNIDLADLSETRLPDEGSLVEMGTCYTFFWSGLPKDASAFMALDLQLGLRYCRAPKKPPLQWMSDSWNCGSH